MGCCQNVPAQSIDIKIKQAIDSCSIKRLDMLLKIFKSNKEKECILNKEIFAVQGFSFNFIAYCMYKGNYRVFEYFLKKRVSLTETERKMESQGIKLINLICFRGHLNILKLYLNIYLENRANSLSSHGQSFTLELNATQFKLNYDLPIHSACKSGMVNIVAYLHDHFQDAKFVPKEFDTYSTDDQYGEDSGLIACRYGNYTLVKYLHEKCGIDFTQLNNNRENAIMVCVSGVKPSEEFRFLEVISYLVEIIKIDISYKYEELLIISKGAQITTYLETQLEKIGINAKKSEVEISFNSLPRLSVKNPLGDSEFSVDTGKENSFISPIGSIFTKRALSIWESELDF